MANHTTKYGYKGERRDAQIAVRVPPSVAEKLRRMAKDRHVSQADVLIQFIRDA